MRPVVVFAVFGLGVFAGLAVSMRPVTKMTLYGDWGASIVKENGRFATGYFSTSPECGRGVLIDGAVDWHMEAGR